MSSDQILDKGYALALYMKGLASELFKRQHSNLEYPIEGAGDMKTVNTVAFSLFKYYKEEITEKDLLKRLETHSFDNMNLMRIIAEVRRLRKSVDNQQ